ncbi:MAG: hypothetical protein ACFB0B_15390 [Thermonemataceae bacterium]
MWKSFKQGWNRVLSGLQFREDPPLSCFPGGFNWPGCLRSATRQDALKILELLEPEERKKAMDQLAKGEDLES